MENDAVVRFLLLGSGVAIAAHMVSWVVFQLGRGRIREAPTPTALSDWPGPPIDPTQLKPSVDCHVYVSDPSRGMVKLDTRPRTIPMEPLLKTEEVPEPPRERREFRFRGYDHFRDEEVYTWYRRNAQTGEVIGSVSIPVRVFWNRCYDG